MRDIYSSASRLDRIQLCWRLYNYTGHRKLEPFVRAARMERGTVGHRVLAYYYREIGLNVNRSIKKPRATVIDEALKIGLIEAAKTQLKQEDLTVIFDVLNSYFRHYDGESWVPLLDDKGEPLVEVPLTKIIYERPDTETDEGIRIIFNAIIDLVLPPMRVDGVALGARIIDHKFRAQSQDLNPLENQLSLYSAVTGIPDVGHNDVGSQKEGNVNKFRRPNYKYSKTQNEESLKWAIYWMLEADFHDQVETYPPNSTSCDKFGGCMFSYAKSGVCTTIEANREAIINANFNTGKGFSIYEAEKFDTIKDLLAGPVVEVASPVPSGAGKVRLVRASETVPVSSGRIQDSEPESLPLVQSRTESDQELSLVDRILGAEKEI